MEKAEQRPAGPAPQQTAGEGEASLAVREGGSASGSGREGPGSPALDGWSLRQKLQICFFIFVGLLALVGYVSFASSQEINDLVQLILEYDTRQVEISNDIRLRIFKFNQDMEAFSKSWESVHLSAASHELSQIDELVAQGRSLSIASASPRVVSMRDRVNWEGLGELVEEHQILYEQLRQEMQTYSRLEVQFDPSGTLTRLARELESSAVELLDEWTAGDGRRPPSRLATQASALRASVEGLAVPLAVPGESRRLLDELRDSVERPPVSATTQAAFRERLRRFEEAFAEIEKGLVQLDGLRRSMRERLASMGGTGASMQQLAASLRSQNQASADSHRKEALALVPRVKDLVAQASLFSLALGLLIAIYIPQRISRSLHELLRGARRIGTGDLRWDIEIRDRDELGEVGRNFNLMRNNLAQLTERIHRAALGIGAAADAILRSAERQRDSSSEEAVSVRAINATISDLSNTANELNRNSVKVLDIVSMSSDISKRGTEAVVDTLGAIRKITESNRTTTQKFSILTEEHAMIEQIMQTISDVADRTNLLSLNASVEAAKAGSQGKGFALVAAEVRRLADKTVLATQEIAGLINEIQIATNSALHSLEGSSGEIEAGSEKVTAAGAMIHHLNANVQSIMPQIEKMNETIDRQAEMAFQLESAIRHIQESVAQKEKMAVETARVARDLNLMASELMVAVRQFKLA